ncbi:WbqC family protein [Croceivirga thetidis]|uniref:WbqC family protein n=1 Tax=Croceivirga thetidis TaxID=2721623 RepID=A0ABX1GT80_9FLAO|nr:WbqC family protein [Croceivirga thetidis]NKI32819.1 WbqC family protein [Croceivirga thetidis]
MENHHLLHPVYFPNVATLALIVKLPVIWEVYDNFQKQTFRNRCYIATDQGKHMLNVPIKHIGGNQGRQLFKEVKIDYSSAWQKQHWKTLQTSYRTSPFFEYYEDDLSPIFEKKYEFLMDLNFETIQFFCDSFQVTMPLKKSKNYQKTPLDIVDNRSLAIAKTNFSFVQEEYFQVFGERHGFLKNLSGLDLLFNKGPEAMEYLNSIKLE